MSHERTIDLAERASRGDRGQSRGTRDPRGGSRRHLRARPSHAGSTRRRWGRRTGDRRKRTGSWSRATRVERSSFGHRRSELRGRQGLPLSGRQRL